MYCEHCGKENSDNAKFCRYCGNEIGKKQTASSKSRKVKLLLCVLVVGIGLGAIGYKFLPEELGGGFGIAEHETPQFNPNYLAEVETYEEETEEVETETAQETTGEVETETVRATTEETEAETAQNANKKNENASPVAVKSESTWHLVTEVYNPTVDTVIKDGKEGLYNFYTTAAVGTGTGKSDGIVTVEAGYGFVAKVLNNDEIKITCYNNTTETILPKTVTAESPYGDKTSALQATKSISGYGKVANGFGHVTVEFSTGKSLTVAVYKENDKLYVCNVAKAAASAENFVRYRENTQKFMDEHGIKPENSLSTNPIYYPIVPQNNSEKVDVDYWLAKADEITDDSWTNAHKVIAIYDYITDNIAYDQWVLGEAAHSRTFYYNDFTGAYFTSKTKVGVCEDVSQIFAIMCREEEIPTVIMANGEHAWNLVYISDYGRWVTYDATFDLKNACYNEDCTKWTVKTGIKYQHIDKDARFTEIDYIGVGNAEDMKKYGIPLYPK